MITNQTLTLKESGIRLDAALFSYFPTSTKSFIREAIVNGDILLGGKKFKKSLVSRTGMTLTVLRLAEREDNIPLPDEGAPLSIVYEDAAIIALDKPAGQSVHPLKRDERGTLMNAVVAHCPQCAALGDAPLMAGALHRIDSGTSGLVLAAKTPEAFSALRSQFSAQTVEKKYLALVEGRIEKAARLENDLSHDPYVTFCRMIDSDRNRLTNAQRAALRRLHAVTEYAPVAWTQVENEERTLLEITIHTGVTHQIRAQLAIAGIHIINDRLYGAFAVEQMQGHCLHSLSARFLHPTSGVETFISTPLPSWAASLWTPRKST